MSPALGFDAVEMLERGKNLHKEFKLSEIRKMNKTYSKLSRINFIGKIFCI